MVGPMNGSIIKGCKSPETLPIIAYFVHISCILGYKTHAYSLLLWMRYLGLYNTYLPYLLTEAHCNLLFHPLFSIFAGDSGSN